MFWTLNCIISGATANIISVFSHRGDVRLLGAFYSPCFWRQVLVVDMLYKPYCQIIPQIQLQFHMHPNTGDTLNWIICNSLHSDTNKAQPSSSITFLCKNYTQIAPELDYGSCLKKHQLIVTSEINISYDVNTSGCMRLVQTVFSLEMILGTFYCVFTYTSVVLALMPQKGNRKCVLGIGSCLDFSHFCPCRA